jgi:hypothetical protein
MTLNRRLGGWWRLWLALTGVWFLACLGYYLMLGPTHSADVYRQASLSVYCSVTTPGGVRDYSYFSDAALKAIIESPDTDGLEAYQSDLCLQEKRKDDRAEYRERVVGQAVAHALLFVAPVLLVLAIGLVIRWVSRGFKSR